MKKINFLKSALVVALLALTTVSIQSCKKDEDPDRDKFLGNWNGQETCTVGSDSYTLGITASSTEEVKIVLSNVYNQAFTATATVSGSTFTVASQSVGSGVTLSGSGTISGDALTFQYNIQDLASTNACTFIGTRL